MPTEYRIWKNSDGLQLETLEYSRKLSNTTLQFVEDVVSEDNIADNVSDYVRIPAAVLTEGGKFVVVNGAGKPINYLVKSDAGSQLVKTNGAAKAWPVSGRVVVEHITKSKASVILDSDA